MAAEAEPHGGQHAVLEVGLAAGVEALVQGGREDVGRNGLVDGGVDGPASLAGVGDAAGEALQPGVLGEGRRGQVEEPRGDDAAAPPDLGDVRDVEVVLVVLRVPQRCGLRVLLVAALADVGLGQDVQPLGISGHEPVLDSVVDHLDEVSGPVRPAVQIAVLRGAAQLLASRGAWDVAPAGGEGGEDRVEALHDLVLAADHEAVAALEAPHASARAHVDVVQPLGAQALRARDVVVIVGVAAVDDRVVLLQQRLELADRGVDVGRGYHEAQRARRVELLRELGERGRSRRAFLHERVDRLR